MRRAIFEQAATMGLLSVLVWLFSILIFIAGIISLFRKKVLMGLLGIGASVLIWLLALTMLFSAGTYERTQKEVANAQERAGGAPVSQADFANANRDIEIVKSEWKTSAGGSIALWEVTLHNKSSKITYADIQFRTSYSAPSGTRVSSGKGTLYEVLKPGETKKFPEINDGFINSQAKEASITIVDAATR